MIGKYLTDESVNKGYDKKLIAINDTMGIIDRMQEYAKCGLACNGRNYTISKVWADKLRSRFNALAILTAKESETARTDELKPCPFCGSSATLEVGEPHSHSIASFMPDAPGYILISCSQCSAAVMTDGQDIEQGKRAWNRRAEAAQEAREDGRKKCAELLAALKECIYCSEHFGKEYTGRNARDRAKALIRKYDSATIAGKEE